ncbi:hypothetical protein GCM10010330_77870 [Streptomyces tendae]|uniref:hypothetical protein n=1 Tax=Streptomyces tendae TaxID=1932 RepID=UPI00167B3506|nr:hypothetical protein [Streptomyces tendae]GHB12195.1 hypothetical protein GCM10010330_77870 [Streptomyces tendae]
MSPWEKWETAAKAILADPAVARLRDQIDQEEHRLGAELRPSFHAWQERYDAAVRDGDLAALARVCPAKHGQWGRICVLDTGHDTTAPHWGTTRDGQCVAWIGTAPDD